MRFSDMPRAIANRPAPKLQFDCFLNDEQLCEKFGLSRYTSWRYRTRKRNPIPFVKLGKYVYYDPRLVDRWVESCSNLRSASARRASSK